MSRDEATCIELKFSRGPSTSRRAKAKDLWTFLDGQTDLKPYKPPTKSTDIDSNDSSIDTSQKNFSDETLTQEDCSYPWYNELRRFQRLGLDKIALAAKNTCSDNQQSRLEKNMRQNEYLADMVEEPYEKMSSDLQAFDERLKKNPISSGSQQIYKVPQKYERFM